MQKDLHTIEFNSGHCNLVNVLELRLILPRLQNSDCNTIMVVRIGRELGALM